MHAVLQPTKEADPNNGNEDIGIKKEEIGFESEQF